MKVQGQRQGDNGERYDRAGVREEVEKQLELLAKEHKKKRAIWSGGSMVGGGSITYLIISYLLGYSPQGQANQVTPVNDNIKTVVYSTRDELRKVEGDFKSHVDRQEEREKRIDERYSQTLKSLDRIESLILRVDNKIK